VVAAYVAQRNVIRSVARDLSLPEHAHDDLVHDTLLELLSQRARPAPADDPAEMAKIVRAYLATTARRIRMEQIRRATTPRSSFGGADTPPPTPAISASLQ
jgi:DNA-directed RNA polymerase specialized sigma24 family protein